MVTLRVPNPLSTFSVHDPIKDCTRGVKRDASIFPKLKDEKQWNEWYTKTKAQVISQFVDEIFDIYYTHGSIDDKHIFDLKKRFTYAIFTNTLLTDNGKPPVRQQKGDYNTHTIYKELLVHIRTSTKSSVESFTILKYIKTARSGTGAWNGSSESFILH